MNTYVQIIIDFDSIKISEGIADQDIQTMYR